MCCQQSKHPFLYFVVLKLQTQSLRRRQCTPRNGVYLGVKASHYESHYTLVLLKPQCWSRVFVSITKTGDSGMVVVSVVFCGIFNFFDLSAVPCHREPQSRWRGQRFAQRGGHCGLHQRHARQVCCFFFVHLNPVNPFTSLNFFSHGKGKKGDRLIRKDCVIILFANSNLLVSSVCRERKLHFCIFSY